MTKKYREWIEATVPTIHYARGRCVTVAKSMQFLFPELRLCKGYYIEPGKTIKHPHWWLKNMEGAVIDPTIIQFEDGGKYLEENS